MTPEARPNPTPIRTRNVYTGHRRAWLRSGVHGVTRSPISGSGEIRTHGTLSRTHTFQTSSNTVSRVRARARKGAFPRFLRANDRALYSRVCARRRTQTVHSAHEKRVARATDAEMQAAFEPLCERCDVAFHLPGDRFCAPCRAAVDREFAGVPT